MNAEQRAALRKVAEEAKIGKLHRRTNCHPETDGTPWGWFDLYESGSMNKAIPAGISLTWAKGKQSEKNCEYIAAANPKAILQLLDYIETMEKDAARWRYARQFLAIEDIEAWNSPELKGYQPNESENIRADEAIDAAMQGETE